VVDREVTPSANDLGARHLSEHDLASYLDGSPASTDRVAIDAHLEACAACRRELIETRRLLDGLPRRAGRVTRFRLRPRLWIAAAVAAGLAALALVPRMLRSPPVPAAAVRGQAPDGEAGRRIVAVTPSEAATTGTRAVTFVWRAAAADLYRFYLLTDSGEPLWTTATSETTLTLPATVSLQKGHSYFWRVDGIANGITATTGARFLRIGP
jgi:hypothetical protein